MPTSSVIDRYIAQARRAHRPALMALADAIKSAAPRAEVSVRRGVPAFHHLGKPLVSFGDAAHHVSLYLMYGKVLASFSQRLHGYSSSNTVIRFDPAEPVPTSLVSELVRARVEEIERALSDK